MESLVPAVLFTYLTLFKPHFTISGYILGLLITGGRKTMNRVAQTCFWVDRHLSSWERFLAEYRWDPTALLGTLLETLKPKLGKALLVHGAFLAVVDTLLMAKNGRRTLGVQAWKDHSGNADRGDRIRGHHWALVGLIAFSPLWGSLSLSSFADAVDFWSTQPLHVYGGPAWCGDLLGQRLAADCAIAPPAEPSPLAGGG